MAGATSESGVGRSLEGALSGEALAEWRSSEQVENGITSTSPPYWDTDDDEDCGPKPSDMYGNYTWKIDKFSQINKRELRSNAFEVGSYKWYVLIYPQGCDVSNHLSLFLCVANHDKLLPGWSHFAQFTIAVVNKDPKKSKYSDTLHRFWKKEHDWGWKKFMELSKVFDGFVDADTLIVKAQVQVIRERPDRPFRCLDSLYRRELVRGYLTNVEQICRHFVEERRNKLVTLIEDKARWSSFRAFWIATDHSAKRHMCGEKTDAILRVIVKQTFIEKEVTSTLVMDSLYSGLRALEDQSKSKLGSKKLLNAVEYPAPIVHVENDMFVLADDVLKLLERAAIEPLPPKDDKGPQNRMKDECIEDCSKDSIACDERRLTELGRKTIEIFALANIFGKIEVAYLETIALKRQEELIHEEEVWLAETEQKAKRGVSEKEKKLKKKQTKQKQQKRNNRKEKDKGKTEKPSVAVEDDLQPGSCSDDEEELIAAVSECLFDKSNKPEYVSNMSDSVSCLPKIPSPNSEKRDTIWDVDVLEIHPPTDASSSGVCGHSGVRREAKDSLVDDSSSTCSTDSVPSAVMNGLYSGYSFPKPRNRISPDRIKNHQERATANGAGYYDNVHGRQVISGASKLIGAGGSGKAELQSKVATLSLNSRKNVEHHTVKKENFVSLQRESSIKCQVMEEKPYKEKPTKVPPSPITTPSKIMSSTVPTKTESKISNPTNPVLVKKPSFDSLPETERATSIINMADSTSAVTLEAHKVIPQKPTNKPSARPLPVVSRPLSAPIFPGSKPPYPSVSHAQTSPLLSRSASATGRLGPDSSLSYLPLSYKNAIMGINRSNSPSSSPNPSQSRTQMSDSPSSSWDPSQSQTQVSHSPCSSFNPSQSHTLVPRSPSSSCNPLQSHTQVSQSPSSSPYPSQSHTQISHLPTSSFNPFQSHAQMSHSRSSPSDSSHWHTQMPNLTSASLSSPLSPEIIEPEPSKPSISFGVVNQNLVSDEPHLSESPWRENSNSPGLVNTSQTSSQEELTHSGLGDDFPHLDIINSLLDEQQEFMIESLRSLNSGDPQLGRHVSFPVDISGMPPEPVAASIASCRFDQDYYDDGYQLGYGSLAGHFDSLDLGHMVPQINPGLYVNEPIDGLIANQWQMIGVDKSYYSGMNAEVNNYPYNFLEYANLVCNVMDYTAFGPSNAH